MASIGELGELETVSVVDDDGVATVMLNRPSKRNAMNPTMHREMYEVLTAIEGDESVRVVIITGAGSSFCAGQDLKEYFKDVGDDARLRRRYDRLAEDWRSRLLRMLPVPTIAMVNGYCFGGAFSIVAACDIAIAADDATFGLSEVNWGAIPGGLVSRVITEQMTMRDALYYALTGETFTGLEAAAMRFINRSVPADTLSEAVGALARKLAVMDPFALQAAKEAIKVVDRLSYDDASWWLKSKSEALRLKRGQTGKQDGIAGFLDKQYRPGFESFSDSSEK